MASIFSPSPRAVPPPPPPPPLPPAAIPPTMANPQVKAAGEAERSRAAMAAGTGMGNTLKTSSQGDLGSVSNAKPSLLG